MDCVNGVLHHMPTSLSGFVWLLRTLQEECVSAYREMVVFCFTPTALPSSNIQEAFIRSRKSWHSVCTLFSSSERSVTFRSTGTSLVVPSLQLLSLNTSVCNKSPTALSLSKMAPFIIVAIVCRFPSSFDQLSGCCQLVQAEAGISIPPRVILLVEACQSRIISVHGPPTRSCRAGITGLVSALFAGMWLFPLI